MSDPRAALSDLLASKLDPPVHRGLGPVIRDRALAFRVGFTPEELEERLNSVGASETPTLLGLNPFIVREHVEQGYKRTTTNDHLESVRILYRQKRRELPQWDGNDAALLGQCLEDGIAMFHAIKNGWTIERIEAKSHAKYPHITASCDRAIVPSGSILEIKHTRSSKGWGPAKHQMPGRVRVQVAQQFAVVDREHAYVGTVILGTGKLFEANRELVFESQVLAAADDFWNYVTAGREPDEAFVARHAIPGLKPE